MSKPEQKTAIIVGMETSTNVIASNSNWFQVPESAASLSQPVSRTQVFKSPSSKKTTSPAAAALSYVPPTPNTGSIKVPPSFCSSSTSRAHFPISAPASPRTSGCLNARQITTCISATGIKSGYPLTWPR